MQQGIKKLQWFEYLKVIFLEILNPLLHMSGFANQVTYLKAQDCNSEKSSSSYHFISVHILLLHLTIYINVIIQRRR